MRARARALKVSPPHSLLEGGRARVRVRNKMTHCRGHSRTAPPGTCRSRDRDRERRRSQRPPRTGCGCYTCGGETGSWQKTGLELGGGWGRVRRGMDNPRLGRNCGDHARDLVWALFSVSCLLSPTRQDSSVSKPWHGMKLRAGPEGWPRKLLPQPHFITFILSVTSAIMSFFLFFLPILTIKPPLCSQKSKM